MGQEILVLSTLSCGDCGAALPPYQGTGRRRQRCMDCAASRRRLINRESARRWATEHPDRAKAKTLVWRSENRERVRLCRKRWREADIERTRENGRQYARESRRKPDVKRRRRAYQAAREASKIMATPRWADLGVIKRIYEACPSGHHVDHIIPLKHHLVCGLHVPENLQYLPAVENIRKKNRFDPSNHWI